MYEHAWPKVGQVAWPFDCNFHYRQRYTCCVPSVVMGKAAFPHEACQACSVIMYGQPWKIIHGIFAWSQIQESSFWLPKIMWCLRNNNYASCSGRQVNHRYERLFFITYNLTNDIMKIDGHQTRTQRNIILIKGPKKGHIGAADYHRKPTNSSWKPWVKMFCTQVKIWRYFETNLRKSLYSLWWFPAW